MSRSITRSDEINVNKNHDDACPRHKGAIVFCEATLHYEKGLKAWIVLGPYLLGALSLEMLIDPGRAHASTPFWPWVGFLAYLVLFPPAWRRILKLVTSKKAGPVVTAGPSVVELP